MNNNNEHFNYKDFSGLINDFADFLKLRINEISNENTNESYQFLNDLLIRFKINIKSIALILPNFQTEIEYKIPLSLLLRSINSDVLTAFYLCLFIRTQDKDNIGLKNEIKILNKDYINFIKEFNKEELELMNKYFSDRGKYINNLEKTINNHFVNYPEYYVDINDKMKLISNDELRKNTPSYFFEESEDRNKPNTFMTEKYKYEKIKKLGKDKYCGQAFLQFKYYSQFQHVSPLTSVFLHTDPKFIDYKFLLMSIENVFISTNLILKNIINNGYKDEINIYVNRLLKISKDFQLNKSNDNS